ncbi:type II secretion system protein GspD [Pelomonas sp. SE-A7]|uniref:type II secretion system protein GspD n=1 Tax=Pelomonas sp. SE-A7 TaxID=3054953 RepID=UPI00259C7C6E|nr:type II secretion system protein GspD [Pelomonas sp. SE-A7]MDM4767539.1 type II secretion system protein GspD [Pelomonas sp. SE-A7]
MPARATLASCLLLGACAQIEPRLPAVVPGAASVSPSSAALGKEKLSPTMGVAANPVAPAASQAAADPVVPVDTSGGEVLAAVNLQQVALPAFVQFVYAEVLRKNVNVHPSITARQDLVTFRTGGGQTAAQIEQAVRLLLKSYGVSAIDVGGLVRVVPDNAQLGSLPTIRYGSATADVPLPLRPVFQLVTLSTVRQTDVTNWLRTMFGERITVQEDAGRNAVLLRGNPDDMKAALEAIEALDQPAMKGRASLALTPAFWSSEELARRLAEVLGAEGYAVHPVGQAITPGASRYPVILLPVAALNAVYVFAATDAVANHVAEWARTLDKPNERGIGKNFFTYAVKHKDAELLGQTLDRILTGNRGATPAAAAPGTTAGSDSATTRLTSVVVDKSTNVLIFQARPDEYGQITSLLQTLDRPTKAALIEVTVAELSVDDSRALGVEWLSDHGGSYNVNTQGGTALGTAGLNFKVFNNAGGLRVALNALASNNRATILSSPRLMARNGEAATIQVGQEVPIITSQQSTGTTAVNNGLGLLQTVQYRSTGVILRIKPVIHSGDQVDLDVTQEVSEAGKTETGVASSPTFQTRKVDTKLTLRNGATVLLGGLISETGSQGNAGVPFLKDLPLIGSFFSKQSKGGVRRELIVLITPYIANDSHDAEAITDAFRKQLGSWASGPDKPDTRPAGTPQR